MFILSIFILLWSLGHLEGKQGLLCLLGCAVGFIGLMIVSLLLECLCDPRQWDWNSTRGYFTKELEEMQSLLIQESIDRVVPVKEVCKLTISYVQ